MRKSLQISIMQCYRYNSLHPNDGPSTFLDLLLRSLTRVEGCNFRPGSYAPCLFVVPRCGDPRVPATMDAETMMPLFIFLLSRSSLQRPHACLAYLANFALSRTK